MTCSHGNQKRLDECDADGNVMTLPLECRDCGVQGVAYYYQNRIEWDNGDVHSELIDNTLEQLYRLRQEMTDNEETNSPVNVMVDYLLEKRRKQK